jgi:hypothetical protein
MAKIIEQLISGTAHGPMDSQFAMYQGDCVEVLTGIPADSLHFSIFSPPFGSLYSYTDAVQDMSNVRTDAEFFAGMDFMVAQLARVLMPGRLVSFHCMNLPATLERDGYIGIKDFRGDLIRAFQKHGFIYHSEVVIWKDPLVAATRTHAIGLAHKQIATDSAMCRQGIPDYLVTMRKPGKNPQPVIQSYVDAAGAKRHRGFERYIGEDPEPKVSKGRNARENKYSHHVWQRYASPVWFDINPSDTLQKASARDDDDSRHICPLQLTVIRRAIELWSNPGDVVFSPFAGIGSEGYVALQEGRRFVGAELKDTYYRQACANLKNAIAQKPQPGLFANDSEVPEVKA